MVPLMGRGPIMIFNYLSKYWTRILFISFFTTPNIKFKVYESSYRMGPVGCETNFYLNIATLINLHV
ncbi:MAG TPA: hypothetical protein VF242_10620 [Nitrososphaeraceae archaeon]